MSHCLLVCILDFACVSFRWVLVWNTLKYKWLKYANSPQMSYWQQSTVFWTFICPKFASQLTGSCVGHGKCIQLTVRLSSHVQLIQPETQVSLTLKELVKCLLFFYHSLTLRELGVALNYGKTFRNKFNYLSIG